MAANPFLPEMWHFALPLHAHPTELVALAGRWAARHDLYVAIERFHPTYAAAAVPLAGDLAAAIAGFDPVRRICLRRGVFDVGSINAMAHLVRNPETFVMVLEPLTDDGLRATALTSRMGDPDALRWWVALAREETAALHRGATAIDPVGGGRKPVPDHYHTEGAHDLAARGVPMLAAAGNALFRFDDLAA
ncbi:MAG: hypothetical protein QOJ35_4085 [Solirubrobacteraceae bacterium]|nr:hypothetical protein [Solirubrobacteraceae bacterium]